MNKFECIKGVFGSDLKPRARLVLQCLIYHADKDGFCFPSVKTIAAECGYGISTVKRALNDLCEAGYIEKTARFDKRKNGGQTSNLYSLTGNGAKSKKENDKHCQKCLCGDTCAGGCMASFMQEDKKHFETCIYLKHNYKDFIKQNIDNFKIVL